MISNSLSWKFYSNICKQNALNYRIETVASKLSTQANFIWFAHGEFSRTIARSSGRVFWIFLKKTIITQRNSQWMFPYKVNAHSKMLFSLPLFSRNAWKFLEKSAASGMNSEERYAMTLWWMVLILKGRFHCFQLFNCHFIGIQLFLRTFSFHIEVLKGVFSFW